MNTYTDTDLPTLKKGQAVYSIAECSTHFNTNYEWLRNQLESKLGLTPQWKREMAQAGTLHEIPYNGNHEPKPYEITRIRSMPTGFRVLTISRGTSNLQVQEDSFNDAFCTDVQAYIDGRMQSTADKMIADKKSFDESEESKRKAQHEIDLADAKKLLARDADMPDFQRNAMKSDYSYAAKIEAASKLINASAKPKKAGDSAMVRTNKQLAARASVKYAEQAVTSRKKILAIRKRQGKQGEIDEAQSDFHKAESKLIAAKNALSTFQC